jgi:YVTN family beta-propeller protein
MGPEQMIISGNYLFVANSGGWGYDNSVSVIDTRSGKVTQTLTLCDIPVAMVADRDNNVWVLCRGKVVYGEWPEVIEETDSKLVRINSATMTVDKEIITGQIGDGFNPSWLTINSDGDMLYYGEADGLYGMSIDDTQQPQSAYIGKTFSYAGADPVSGMIFALEITGYSSTGLLHIYDGDSLVSTYETGIAPGGIVFTDFW